MVGNLVTSFAQSITVANMHCVDLVVLPRSHQVTRIVAVTIHGAQYTHCYVSITTPSLQQHIPGARLCHIVAGAHGATRREARGQHFSQAGCFFQTRIYSRQVAALDTQS